MNKNYQLDYAAGRPQMYEKAAREKRAKRVAKLLGDYFGKGKLRRLTLLDIGASTGIIDNVLSKSFKKVVGIDIDKKAIEFAKKNFKRKNLIFEIGDAINLPFKNKSFDVVVCMHVYEHVPDQQKLFGEIYRVLKPGGVCYLAAQNKLWPWEPHYNLPFLSWLPRSATDFLLQRLRKAKEYYESPKTYWGLKQLTKEFQALEYTQKILRHPKEFGYDNVLNPPISYISYLLSPLAKLFSPTFFWLLVKK